jgi:hypothetical protein
MCSLPAFLTKAVTRKRARCTQKMNILMGWKSLLQILLKSRPKRKQLHPKMKSRNRPVREQINGKVVMALGLEQ